MPKVLIVAETDLAPLLRGTCLWGRDVQRVATPSPEVALDVVRVFVPSLVVIEAATPARAADLVGRFRSNIGTRRSSIILALPEGTVVDEKAMWTAGANLVIRGANDAERLDGRLAILLSVPRRVRMRFPVLVRIDDRDHEVADAIDVSSSGMLLQLSVPPAVGTTIELRFTPPGSEHEQRAEACVVRRLAGVPARVGVRFGTLAAETERKLRLLVSSVPAERAFGRYQPRAVIGEGSMGRVYRAFDPAAHRVVAVKTVRPDHMAGDDGAEYLRRFQREARAAARLVHPNIVTIFDVGRDYFVMELLEGPSFQEFLEAHGKLPLDEVGSILAPVAQALDYAHGMGTIHRDIKPANIVVTSDGRPKVMDFGIAHLASGAASDSGIVLGSPAYMAPEQITSAEVTPRADIFSLAAVAYEAVTGQRPFTGQSVAGVLWAVVNSDPVAASSLRPDLSPSHDAAFAAALAKKPGARPPTAAAFVEALLPGSIAVAAAQARAQALGIERRLAPPPVRDPSVETLDLHRK